MNLTKSILLLFILAALFASGLAVRRVVLSAQYERYGRPLPFDLESALNFRHVRELFETGALPVVDKKAQFPRGVVVRQTYETVPEYVCAFLARLFPANVGLDERVRWISAGWFCLGIPALILWIWWWQGSLWGAALGGAYYAFSLSSVIRSTGQELSHENFALPLLIAHFAVSVLADRENYKSPQSAVTTKRDPPNNNLFSRWRDALSPRRSLPPSRHGKAPLRRDNGRRSLGRRVRMSFVTDSEKEKTRFMSFILLSALSAILLACALITWDLIQFYVMFWALLGFIRAVKGGYFQENCRRLKWGIILAALVLAGVLNPYLRAHGFVFSPSMLLAYGVLLAAQGAWQAMPIAARPAGHCENSQKHWRNSLLRAGLALLPVIIGCFLCRAYMHSYDHFAELLYAKIIFFNSKPADPSLLTFAQRILWVPALNSASFLLTKNIFPVSLALFLVSTVIFLFNPRWRTDPEISGLFFFSFMSLIAFILFVRFHVFAAVGFAAVIGLVGARTMRLNSMSARVLVVFLMLCGATVEAFNVIQAPGRWGSSQPYLRQRLELVDWLKVYAPGQPVLANFGISAFVLAYADSPIILHPKFESPEIRARVREYGEKLFKSDENQFRLWADKFGAAFYIHSLGEFADVCPEAQMRYFVDALNPPPAAAARIFEFNPMASRWFVLLWDNPKYRVFRIITTGDENTARTKAESAQKKIAGKLLQEAQTDAELALLYDPGNKSAQEAILRIDGLKKR